MALKHTSMLCKGYMIRPPQSLNLNLLPVVWGELDRTLKEK